MRRIIHSAVAFWMVVTAIPVLGAQAADLRVALVIGNSAYQKVPALINPRNDAADVGTALERLGFSVARLTDAGFETTRRALIEFGRRSREAEMSVVFFAGHGMEIGGENWLIPVDAELRSDSDAENETISLRTVVAQVAFARELGLVILDACRNNPFAAKMQRSVRVRAVTQGLARTEPSDNVLVAYAAKDGTTATDGAGRNSPFTAALLKHIETPGLEVSFVFRNVRDEVMAATNREQQPFVYGSLSGRAIYFKPPVMTVSAQPSSLPPVSSSRPKIESTEAASPFTLQDRARLDALVARRGFLLPEFQINRPDNAVPEPLRRFVGIWSSNSGFGGIGRHGMLIVTTVDAAGRINGFFLHGPPTPKSYEQTPASSSVITGSIDGGVLNYTYRSGTGRIVFSAGDSLLLTQKRRDGRSPQIVLESFWRLTEREKSTRIRP